MRVDRLLAIAVTLINRDRITARELADRFGVTVRTIYRDIEALDLAGIPVVSYPGNNGGFGLVENYRWNHQLLGFDDMIAMLGALKGVNATLDDSELDSAIEKVSSLVPPDRSAALEDYLDRFVVDMEPWSPGGSGTRPDSRGVADGSRTAAGGAQAGDGATPLSQPDAVRLHLRFRPEARFLVEEYFEGESISECSDGSIEVSVTFPEGKWIESMILSYGELVEVLSPASYRRRIADAAKKVVEIYRKDSQT